MIELIIRGLIITGIVGIITLIISLLLMYWVIKENDRIINYE